MRRVIFHKIDLVEYITVILMVILTGSARLSVEEGSSAPAFHMFSLVLIAFLVINITKNFRVLPRRSSLVIIFIAAVFYFGISILNYSETYKGLLLRIVWFVLIYGMCIESKEKRFRLLKKLYNVIVVIALVAIVFFVIVNFMNVRLPFEYIEHEGIKTYYKEYFHIFCTADRYHRTNVFGLSFFRLQSFFWEPGIFAIYLSLAMFYYVFYDENRKWWKILLLTVCMIFTISTTGIIIAAMLISINIVKYAKVKKRQKILVALPISLVSIVTMALVWIEKMTRTNIENGSYYIRMNDLKLGLKVITERPIIGFGYKNYEHFLLLSEQGNSNGIIIWGFTMGLVGLALLFIPFVYVLINDKQNRFIEGVYFLLYVLFNMTEPLLTSPVMLFLLIREYCRMHEIINERKARDRVGL